MLEKLFNEIPYAAVLERQGERWNTEISGRNSIILEAPHGVLVGMLLVDERLTEDSLLYLTLLIASQEGAIDDSLATESQQVWLWHRFDSPKDATLLQNELQHQLALSSLLEERIRCLQKRNVPTKKIYGVRAVWG